MNLLVKNQLRLLPFRSTSPKDIVNARTKVMAMALADSDVLTTIEPYRPITDGAEFTDQALNLFRDGKWQTHKEVLMGTTTQELEDIKTFLSNVIIGEEMFMVKNMHFCCFTTLSYLENILALTGNNLNSNRFFLFLHLSDKTL